MRSTWCFEHKPENVPIFEITIDGSVIQYFVAITINRDFTIWSDTIMINDIIWISKLWVIGNK